MLTVIHQKQSLDTFTLHVVRSNLISGLSDCTSLKGSLETIKTRLIDLIAYDITNQFNKFLKDIKENVNEHEFIEDKDNIDYLWNVLKELIQLREDKTENYLKRIAEIIIENKGGIFKTVKIPDNVVNYDKAIIDKHNGLRLAWYITVVNTCNDFLENELNNYL